MNTKLFFTTIFFIASIYVLTACSPSLSLQADNKNGFSLSFSTGFSTSAADTIRSIFSAVNSNINENMPVIPASDISTVLKSSGFTNIAATNPTSTSVNISAIYQNLSESSISATGLITRSSNSITFTLGPKQLTMLYMLSDQDAQTYFDLLMIPALEENTNKITISEYTDLLANLYGKQFATDLINGSLHIELISPDKKKKTIVSMSLGEILTNKNEQSWSVTW